MLFFNIVAADWYNSSYDELWILIIQHVHILNYDLDLI